MRINVEDDTIDEIVKNWLTMNAIQLKDHDDEDMRDLAEACRNVLEINWPHLYE